MTTTVFLAMVFKLSSDYKCDGSSNRSFVLMRPTSFCSRFSFALPAMDEYKMRESLREVAERPARLGAEFFGLKSHGGWSGRACFFLERSTVSNNQTERLEDEEKPAGRSL